MWRAPRTRVAVVRSFAATSLRIGMAAGAGWWIARQSPPIPLLAMVAAVLLVGIALQPRIWLVLIISLSAFRNYDNVLAGGFLSWSKLLTLAMLAIYVARIAAKRAQIHVFRAWLLPIVLIIAWSTASLLWAFDQTLAFMGVVSWLSLFALQALIYTLFRNDLRAVEMAISAFIASMMVFGVAAVYAVFLAPSSDFAGTVMGWRIFGGPSGQELGRFTGFYADANSTALLLTYAVLLALALASSEQSFSWSARARRYLLLAVALFLVFPLVITYSRTGLLAFLVGAVYLVSRRGVGIRPLIVLAVAGGLLYLYQEGLVTRFAELPETRWGSRMFELELGLVEFLNAPITGIGLQSYRPKFLASDITVYLGSIPVIHNTYLKFLVELGLPGFLLLLWLCVALIRRYRKNSQLVDKTMSPKLRWINVGLGACLLSTGVFAIPLGVMGFNIFWILLGLFAVISDAIEEAFDESRANTKSQQYAQSKRTITDR